MSFPLQEGIHLRVVHLVTKVGNNQEEDIIKLERMMSYLRGSTERRVVLRLGEDELKVRLYVDAAYGVHSMCGDRGPGCGALQVREAEDCLEVEHRG